LRRLASTDGRRFDMGSSRGRCSGPALLLSFIESGKSRAGRYRRQGSRAAEQARQNGNPTLARLLVMREIGASA
jgi:hypothetical protein